MGCLKGQEGLVPFFWSCVSPWVERVQFEGGRKEGERGKGTELTIGVEFAVYR